MGRNRRHDIVKPSKYKTSMCSFFASSEGCPFGENCAFAHGEAELRVESRDNAPPEDAAVGAPSASPAVLAESKSASATATVGADSAAGAPAETVRQRGGAGGTCSPRSDAGTAGEGVVGGGGSGEEVPSRALARKRTKSAANTSASPANVPAATATTPTPTATTTAAASAASGRGLPKEKSGRAKARQTAATPQTFVPVSGVVSGGGDAGAGAYGVAAMGTVGAPVGGSGGVGGGFLNLAEMPYSSNSAVPNAPLYIPTNMAQHPYVNINNSHQLLNVMSPHAAHPSELAGPGAALVGPGGHPPGSGAPYFMYGSGPAVAPPGSFPPAAPNSSAGTNHRQTPKETPTGSPHPPASRAGHVVSSNTLANVGHSRGGRAHHHPPPLPPGAHSGDAPVGGCGFLPFSPGTFNSGGPGGGGPLPLQASGGAGLSLHSLLASQAPPALVHIPVDTPGMSWGGAAAGAYGSPAATPAQQLNSFLQQEVGNGYYAYTVLPNTLGLGQPSGLAQPPRPQAGVPQALSIESLFASLEQQERTGVMGRAEVGAPPRRRPTASDDGDASSEATDLSTFLEVWLRQGGPPGTTDVPAASAVDTAAVPPAAEPGAAAALPTSLTASVLGALRPITLPSSKPVVQLGGALAGPKVPAAMAAPPPPPAAAAAAAGGRPKPTARRQLLCSVWRAGSSGPTGEPESTASGKAAGPRGRRTPIMRNHFKSSCISREEEEQPAGSSILLYSAERNTLYHITAPGAAERRRLHARQLAKAAADAADAKGAKTAAAMVASSRGSSPLEQHRSACDGAPALHSSGGGGPEAGTTNSSGTSAEGTPGEVGVQRIVASEHIIRCRPPQKRYQYPEVTDEEDEMEYCI